MSNLFRAAAHVLRDYIGDTYTLLAASDAVVSFVETQVAQAEQVEPFTIKSPDGHATFNWTTRLWDYDHEYLVGLCLRNDVVLMYVGDAKKIHAIKELRRVVPGVGLKAAKEAVEDSRVSDAAHSHF